MFPFVERENRRGEADERLAGVLLALASANRLALLRQLRAPLHMTEIELTPESVGGRSGTAGGEDRAIARQAVRAHLRKLIDAGAVSMAPDPTRGGSLQYVVSHQRLFEIAEEIRGLARLRPLRELAPRPTVADARERSASATFPRLLLVRGLDEGRTFPLVAPAQAREASWVIGRRKSCDVVLDYDAFASQENSRIAWTPGRFEIESLPSSRNGTTLNEEALGAGEPVPLVHGDVIGVGRSTLVFHGHAGEGR